MTHPLDGCYARLDRAVEHFQLLQAEVDRTIEARKADGEKLWTVAKQFDPKQSRFHLTVGTVMDLPAAAAWGLVASDGIHQLRSVLDNLAWALVKCSPSGLPTADRDRRGIQFPIYEDRIDYLREIDRRLPGVPDYQRAIIERAQPYQPWPHGNHPLRILHGLAIEDKHKTVPVVMFRNSTVTIRIRREECTDCIVEGIDQAENDGSLDLGADVGWVRVRVTGPNPNVYVHCETMAFPAFENGVRIFEIDSFSISKVRDLLNEFRPLLA